MVLTYSRDAQS